MCGGNGGLDIRNFKMVVLLVWVNKAPKISLTSSCLLLEADIEWLIEGLIIFSIGTHPIVGSQLLCIYNNLVSTIFLYFIIYKYLQFIILIFVFSFILINCLNNPTSLFLVILNINALLCKYTLFFLIHILRIVGLGTLNAYLVNYIFITYRYFQNI